MPTTSAAELEHASENVKSAANVPRTYARLLRLPLIRELSIFIAFCGYGAFRLTRTLTRSVGAAWVAGIVFAFVPYRFQVLSHLHHLFAGWIPLLLEASDEIKQLALSRHLSLVTCHCS